MTSLFELFFYPLIQHKATTEDSLFFRKLSFHGIFKLAKVQISQDEVFHFYKLCW